MAITDIQISEELETSAPSIKYRGDEGPKSPQEMEMMNQQIMEMMAGGENNRVRELLLKEETEGLNEDEKEELRELIKTISAQGPILPSDEDPINPFGPKPEGPVLPDRMMAAGGGIMGLKQIGKPGGRVEPGIIKYGMFDFITDPIKKVGERVRKIIPNEIANVAVKAAPFIAPFNPLAAAMAGGLGSFDQTGSISKGLKSGLMNYGLGQGARYLGGAGFQTGINPMTGSGVPGAGFFSSPMGTETGIGKFLDSRKPAFTPSGNKNVRLDQQPSIFGGSQTGDASIAEAIASESSSSPIIKAQKEAFKIADLPGLVKKNLQAAGLGNNLMTGLLVGGLGAGALMSNMTEEEVMDINRGEGLDIEGIRTEVIEAMKDPSGNALKAIRVKYPYLGKRETKDLSAMAMGGRIGKAEGGIMDLGGMEKDYRAEGGFVPIGREEKADDVPARLSVNEFVMTADAVRGMGDGDIDLGAKRMENLMGAMENKKGAQQMFDVSERLSEVV